ncbi:unnamed protein product, partial [Callosobruchus maculatus]
SRQAERRETKERRESSRGNPSRFTQQPSRVRRSFCLVCKGSVWKNMRVVKFKWVLVLVLVTVLGVQLVLGRAYRGGG